MTGVGGCGLQSLADRATVAYVQLLNEATLCIGCQQTGYSTSNSNSHNSVHGAVIVAVHCHCKSSPGSSDDCSTQRQLAADLWTKPISLSQ